MYRRKPTMFGQELEAGCLGIRMTTVYRFPAVGATTHMYSATQLPLPPHLRGGTPLFPRRRIGVKITEMSRMMSGPTTAPPRKKRETRETTLTGEICNGSYVLLVQPPKCRVQRRLFSSNTEKRINPNNLDPYNPDKNYEIFAPGQPTHFSRLETINDNHFKLRPTSPQTRATLQPTLNPGSPWHPRDNAGTRGNLVGSLPSVTPTDYNSMSPRPWAATTGGVNDYYENSITPKWPGEYRLKLGRGLEIGRLPELPVDLLTLQ